MYKDLTYIWLSKARLSPLKFDKIDNHKIKFILKPNLFLTKKKQPMNKYLLLFIFCLSAIFTSAQQNSYWTPVNESFVSKGKNLFTNTFKPSQYRLYQLKENLLRNVIKGTPLEKTVKISSSNYIISVPNAEGKIERFRIIEAPVMQPKLAAKYPDLKSYAGRGIDDPTAIIRFDVTPAGFHAMITSGKNPTYYINPLNQKEGIYIVNPRDENDKSAFKCDLDDSFNNLQETGKRTPLSGNADDATLRIYRLALCVNGEYSKSFLPAVYTDSAEARAVVMASLITNITRANQVYERDYGVRMIYVDNQDTLIFLDTIKDAGKSKNTFNDKVLIEGTDYIIHITENGTSRIFQADNTNEEDNAFLPIRLNLSEEIIHFRTGQTLPAMNYETGILKEGNGNPDSKFYDSLTDYNMNTQNNLIEIRIPWSLIGFTDPSNKEIYEGMKIGGIRINVAAYDPKVLEEYSTLPDSETVEERIYTWDNWDEPTKVERLKASYKIIKEMFKQY